MRDRFRTRIDSVIGAPATTSVARRLTRRALRVLAYHGIDDPDAFEAQLEHLQTHYRPVGIEDVLGWVEGDGAIPELAVWVTFDDGEPSVVELGLPKLRRRGIPSTMFICPGVVDTDTPYWWQVAGEAERRGLVDPSDGMNGSIVAALKRIADPDRRSIVAKLAARIESTAGSPLRIDQITTAQLNEYLDAGGTLGNHTWDHPLLDQADGEEQRAQVKRAHDWFASHLDIQPTAFAYPNGNAAEETRQELRSLGYRVALLFDHRLTASGSPLAMSRLRVNSDDTPARFAAILAGTHPGITHLRTLPQRRRWRRNS